MPVHNFQLIAFLFLPLWEKNAKLFFVCLCCVVCLFGFIQWSRWLELCGFICLFVYVFVLNISEVGMDLCIYWDKIQSKLWTHIQFSLSHYSFKASFYLLFISLFLYELRALNNTNYSQPLHVRLTSSMRYTP